MFMAGVYWFGSVKSPSQLWLRAPPLGVQMKGRRERKAVTSILDVFFAPIGDINTV